MPVLLRKGLVSSIVVPAQNDEASNKHKINHILYGKPKAWLKPTKFAGENDDTLELRQEYLEEKRWRWNNKPRTFSTKEMTPEQQQEVFKSSICDIYNIFKTDNLGVVTDRLTFKLVDGAPNKVCWIDAQLMVTASNRKILDHLGGEDPNFKTCAFRSALEENEVLLDLLSRHFEFPALGQVAAWVDKYREFFQSL
jgi:hypothetical protein